MRPSAQNKKRFNNDEDLHEVEKCQIRSIKQREEEYVLYVKLSKVFGNLHPFLQGKVKVYKVILWVEPNKEYYAYVKEGFIKQDEEIIYKIGLKNPFDTPFLHVEVLTFGSKLDPGPSSGEVVVGRARILYPKKPNFTTKRTSFDLLRPYQGGGEAKPEGCIGLTMKLERRLGRSFS